MMFRDDLSLRELNDQEIADIEEFRLLPTPMSLINVVVILLVVASVIQIVKGL